MTKPITVIGLLGSNLDAGKGAERWERWRPTVALCQHEDLLIRRFELLYQKKFAPLARTVVDDIQTVSPETDVQASEINIDDPWEFEEVYGALHDFALGYQFNEDREDYLVHITTGTHVTQICLFLLTESRHLPAKLIQTSPPPPRRRGGPGTFEIIDLDLSRYDRIASRFQQQQKEGASFLKSGIETRNAAFNRLIERIEQVAIASSDPLLLTGPTGAGKSRLAKRIYELRRARHQVKGRFVEVNCATIRGDAAMSALFGHVKGAFTGAVNQRPGLLRAADGGVLFLDEIAELGSDEQAMLLRALEEKVFFPLGSDREVRSEFQLIAGTNRDLFTRVSQGTFRDDLLARINLWTFSLPGLRDRIEDLEPNLNYELELYANRVGKRVSFSREARDRFLKFALSPGAMWTGNFRDLNGAVVRMATLASGGRITTQIVDDEVERLRSSWKPASGGGEDVLARLMGREKLAQLDLFDREQLTRVVQLCRETATLSEAGRVLFGASRGKKTTVNDADRLRKYLARFGIDWREIKDVSQTVADSA
ncbi:MAG TPA: RNA repair transcriptional activator RtcR [Blastocatellia bacterium]|nr:RNA repair transcriptional activator RtcR [Blastocatellia bacterium]